MFIEIIVISIILGYLFKGNIKNLENAKIEGIWIILIGFLIEVLIIILIRKAIITKGIITYLLNLAMYICLFVFTYLNRKNYCLLIMGVGFILNAIPIFFNGGAMPVSEYAIKMAKLTMDVEKEGLYVLINEGTKFWFLGDVIPLTILRNFAISFGDILTATGLMFFIIFEMKKKK